MMKIWVGACAAAAIAACAPIETPAPQGPPADRLALHADKAISADISAAFHNEIAARYAGDVGQEAVVGDLAVNGFICTEVGAYPQVQPGGVLTECVLPRPHGLCSDKWTVTLRLKRVTRQVSFHRVSAEGTFERFCVAGASPNG